MLISYHGGHSGEFCAHADRESLTAILAEYVRKGFSHIGITEHQPRTSDHFYPEERKLGFAPMDLFNIFREYFDTARSVQDQLKDKINLLVGFETEVCGVEPYEVIMHLKMRLKPDYIVGSVHHIDDIPFDFSEALYAKAIDHCGGIEKLYTAYYDAQYELITRCRPEVIGHFDLIKIFSPDYEYSSALQDAARRNIREAVSYGAVFEVNSRAFKKGMDEPYPGRMILQMIAESKGQITLGDDSHGISQVGLHYDKAIPIVKEYFNSVVAFDKPNGTLEKVILPLD